MTGNEPATSGSIYIEEPEADSSQTESQKQLAICPQSDIFFDDLTVKEHVQFSLSVSDSCTSAFVLIHFGFFRLKFVLILINFQIVSFVVYEFFGSR